MWSFIFQGLMWKLTKNWASEVSCDCFSQSWIMHTLHWTKISFTRDVSKPFSMDRALITSEGKNIPVERQAGLGWRILLGNCFLISVDWENLHVKTRKWCMAGGIGVGGCYWTAWGLLNLWQPGPSQSRQTAQARPALTGGEPVAFIVRTPAQIQLTPEHLQWRSPAGWTSRCPGVLSVWRRCVSCLQGDSECGGES